jgi:NAD(P)-dependent dehydrogenase (short-subunit alcohol dehydrogenase family)
VVNLDAAELFSLAGRTAVLTGATGFLGRTFARAMLSNGARLVALGRSERLESLGSSWAEEFGQDRVVTYRVDMSDLEVLASLLDLIAEREGVDVVVNNAYELSPATGFNGPLGRLEDFPVDQWQRHFQAGVVWPLLTTQKLGPGMKERRRGSIINIATMYATVAPDPRLYEGTPFLNPPGYSAAKGAMVSFTRYVASFWGGYGIRANAICPGPFSNTEEVTGNSVDPDDPFLARLADRSCLRRTGRAEELAGALLFLASDASSFVTGQALAVDGGWTAL